MATTPTNISANNNNASFTSGTSVTVTSTGNVPAGALMIIIISVGGASAPSAITASGWSTALTTTANGSGATVVTAIFTKIAPAPTAAVSQSVTWTTTATNGHWFFSAWNGSSGALDGSVSQTQNASGTNTSPSVTPGTGNVNDTLICGFFAGATGTSTITQPSGMTSVFLAASAAAQASFGVASLALTSASATGAKTWTIGTGHINMGVSFLLNQGPAWGWTSSVDERSGELVSIINTPLVVPYK